MREYWNRPGATRRGHGRWLGPQRRQEATDTDGHRIVGRAKDVGSGGENICRQDWNW